SGWLEYSGISGNSVVNVIGIVAMILGIVVSKSLADRFGKKKIFGLFLFLSAVSLIMFYFYSPTAISAVFITQILHGLLYGVTIPILWAMIADVADYSEWKNHRRATAIIFSAMIFGLKVGVSLGGGMAAYILGNSGYIGDQIVQTVEAVRNIKLSVSVFPGLIFMAGALSLFWYEIDKKAEVEIENALRERRKN